MRRLVPAFVATFLLAASTGLLGQEPPVIDRELFFGDPQTGGAQISPDGRFITFLRPYRDVRNIWVKSMDEPFDAARPLTADTTRPVTGYFWSEDSRYVLYVQDKGGDENYHVYAVDPSAPIDVALGVPAARDLTPYENTRAMIYAVPEGTPDEIIVGLNDRDARWHDAYRVDLGTGERELLLENHDEIAQWVTDHDGRLRMAVKIADDGSTRILRVDGSELVEIYSCSNEETCAPIRFHRNGRQVYFMTNKGDRDLTELTLLDPETGRETFVERDPEGRVDFGGAGFSDATEELTATVYVGDRVRIYPRSDQIRRDLEILRSRFPDAEFSLNSSTEDESLVIVGVGTDVDPGSAYLYDRSSGEIQLLYRSRPELPSAQLGFRKPVRYMARDGLEIPAYLTLPRGAEVMGLPAVILPHGGPWARDFWGYDPYAQFLANRGYAVLQPNFRGSTGYGKHFLNAGNNEWGTGAMQHDLTDGAKWLVQQGIADPARIGIFGGSYGGYATLAGLAFTPDVYAAGVSYVGPSNLITLLNSIPPYWAPVRRIFDVRLGDPDDPEDMERLRAQSPLFSADRITAPLLVIQGANDPRVKQRESEQIVIALRELGRPVEYMLAEDEGHGFAGQENRMAVAAAMERFFARHLGGRYQEGMGPELQAKMDELTVDVNSVEVSAPPTAKADAMSAPLPATDGAKLAPGTLEYAATIKTMGQEIPIGLKRTIEEATVDDHAVWRIIDETSTPMGAATDSLLVDRASLMPVQRSVSGQGSVTMTYGLDFARGEISVPGRTIPVEISLESPAFSGGAGSEIAMAGMELTEGWEGILRETDVQGQRVRAFVAVVTGTESVTTDAGTFETLRVDLTPLDDDPAGGGTLHLMKGAPHYLVTSETKLPAQMGGGTSEVTLSVIKTAAGGM